jgi:phage tail sheath gpL-like
VRAQDSQYNCGPTALYNALQAVGRKRSMLECERLCNTSVLHGTSAEQIEAAVAVVQARRPHYVIATSDPPAAIAMLRDALLRGRAAVMVVDNDEHWVAAVGVLGDRVLVADGISNEIVVSYLDSKLVTRWKSAEGAFWACVL